MKTTDKSSSNFEEQLRKSAHRLRDKQNEQLPLPKDYRHHIAWGWIPATAIAATLVGLVVGILLPVHHQSSQADMAVVTQTDTVVQYKEKLIHDTIVYKVKVPIDETELAQNQQLELQDEIKGCNIECDGIDYAMLVGMQ